MDLYHRLQELKKQVPTAPTSPSARVFPPASAPDGEKDSRDERSRTEGQTAYGDWTQLSQYVFRRSVSIPVAADDVIVAGGPSIADVINRATEFVAPGSRIDELLFFDTETTGLSAGAGSVIFLFGTGRFDGESFIVEQLLLGDYPGEGEFLEQVLARIAGCRALVSYNGRSFDASVLTTRLLMNGIAPGLPAHEDLLYPARRLWKSRIGSCSLGSIESSVLNVARELDVPGELVPEYFFAFLKSGSLESLAPVVAHHQSDIDSLFRLALLFEALWNMPPSALFPLSLDAFQLSRLYVARGREKDALELLRLANGADTPIPDAGRAGLFLGEIYKRRRDWRNAVEVYLDAVNRRSSIRAGIELAKIYEHRLRDPEAASAIVRRLLSFASAATLRDDLRRRKERLDAKLRKKGHGAGSPDTK